MIVGFIWWYLGLESDTQVNLPIIININNIILEHNKLTDNKLYFNGNHNKTIHLFLQKRDKQKLTKSKPVQKA